ncbi:peroxidase-related enzyme [Azospirillum sp. TSO35-2]|uniref:carboxymuconolactone decarboxylase family protein n=1 Tax=Azospirillum sp. TSO35-2 TaxID=716796 RepID=UPI000D618A77|nr:peroxidase-related enzyme [Azospirillum sp. TSO35-2]PWC32903.1 alkylhydroperoxidase [Azospirillum sp. TSO35-2]
MPRIPTYQLENAPEKARPLLQAVQKQIGRVPNVFGTIANSPAALEGYLAMSGALAKGTLPAATRERIALAIAQVNHCGYCLSAHTFFGKNAAKLDDGEIAANRHGASNDPKADAAVRFAVKVARERGDLSEADVEAVRAAGYTDGELVEIVQYVALNSFTNYFNEVFKTEVDFPKVIGFTTD